jgi:hypothetical protein
MCDPTSINAHFDVAIAGKLSCVRKSLAFRLSGSLLAQDHAEMTGCSDTLKRHEEMSCSSGHRKGSKRQHPRVSAACNACARAKVRCSLGSPCVRCKQKGIPCIEGLRRAEQTQQDRANDTWSSDNPAQLNELPLSPASQQQMSSPEAVPTDHQTVGSEGVAESILPRLFRTTDHHPKTPPAHQTHQPQDTDDLPSDTGTALRPEGEPTILTHHQQRIHPQGDYSLDEVYSVNPDLPNFDNVFVQGLCLDFFDFSAFAPTDAFDMKLAAPSTPAGKLFQVYLTYITLFVNL